MNKFCKAPKCRRPCERRGLCGPHDSMMSKLVKDKKITYLKLLHTHKISNGRRDPKTPMPRYPHTRVFVKCLKADCPAASRTRGLCGKHYTERYILVKAGVTSWGYLEFQGVSAPVRKCPENHSFYDWALDVKK